MLSLLLRLCKKNKKENLPGILKRIIRLPKLTIAMFIILVLSIVAGLIFYGKDELLVWFWVATAIEIISTIVLGLTSENFFIDNSQDDMENYKENCHKMYDTVIKKYAATEEQLNILLTRINNEIVRLQKIIDQKQEEFKKLNQVLVIPIILIVVKGLWDLTSDISNTIEIGIYITMFYLLIYHIIKVLVFFMNYDIASRKNQLQSFADDIQGIIDVKFIFNGSGTQLPLENDETNEMLL